MKSSVVSLVEKQEDTNVWSATFTLSLYPVQFDVVEAEKDKKSSIKLRSSRLDAKDDTRILLEVPDGNTAILVAEGTPDQYSDPVERKARNIDTQKSIQISSVKICRYSSNFFEY